MTVAAAEAMFIRCATCGHLPHPGRACRVVRVTAEVETPCDCTEYVAP